MDDQTMMALGAVNVKKKPAKGNKSNNGICEACKKTISQSVKRKEKTKYRRAFSETKLLEILEHDFDTKYTYHCMSNGDIDSLSYLKHIIRQQDLDYCLFSTWCMAMDDVLQFGEWLAQDKIKRLDCYVGEIFTGSYRNEYDALGGIIDKYGGRICVFRNHSKIFAGIGKKFAFSVESSANINTNPRCENTTICFGKDIFLFHKNFFDDVKSFDRRFDNWKKWKK